MGTRCVTNIVDGEGDLYVSLYRQYDGYPQGGHGEELANWLHGAVIGNGIRGGEDRAKFFNGVGDLAARLVTFFKEDPSVPGGFYVIPASSAWNAGVDFVYTVTAVDPVFTVQDGKEPETYPTIKVASGWSGDTLFQGDVDSFLVWIKESSENEDY